MSVFYLYVKVSGLSEWIGDQFIVLDVLPPYAIALVVSVIIAAFTEVTSNTATATIFLPILGSLVRHGQNERKKCATNSLHIGWDVFDLVCFNYQLML